MNLKPGDKLGPYEILEAAGAGGMGEVYKAKDSRLDRTVAIKILPEAVAADPDLRQRFEREAKAISSLNHPHICTLHDIGHQDGLDFLVMEFLEGETLASRLERGPMPVQEVLDAATKISDALDSAHRQGLVHRDLKPGNIMLTKDGAKLMDFGLAKLQLGAQAEQQAQNITRTTPLTGAGMILGTVQYMAPEQLEGKEADARSDIFAFGAVLYEMVTGKRAFEGASQATLIAAIIERQPASIATFNPLAPPGLERLVKKCLAKDPDSRWQTARDLGDELRWIAQSGSKAGIPLQVSVKRRFRMRLAWAIATVATVAALGLAYVLFMQETPTPNVLRFKVATRADLSQVSWPCLSPDGQYLAYKAVDSTNRNLIWMRPLSSLESYAVPGTEGAQRPFWSPDSKYIAFVVGRKQLKKVSVAGGPAQLICETDDGSDGTWGTTGQIIYDAGNGDSLFMVPASGGTPVPLLGIDREAGEITHAWPWFLPDGKHYLYLAEMKDKEKVGGNYLLRVGNVETRQAKTLFPIDARVQYCDPGYLVYFRGGILLAQRFDTQNLEVIGEAVPLTDQVGVGDADRAEFGLSNQGTLTYQTSMTSSTQRLVWFNRKGEEIGQVGAPGDYDDIFLSPDESRLSICISDGDQNDIWVYDLKRDVKTRITFKESDDITPLWSADGKYVYFSNDETGLYKIYKKAANGLGQATLVYANDSLHAAVTTRSPDGRWLYGPLVQNNWDIFRFDTQDTTVAEVIVSTPYIERGAAVSPNGKFLAYFSYESGRSEVYVLELEEGGGRWQISSDGGRYAQWSSDGTQLYYFTLDWEFVSVPVTTDGAFSVGAPSVLFNQPIYNSGYGRSRYVVTKDPDKFLMSIPVASASGGEFNVIVNWQEALNTQ